MNRFFTTLFFALLTPLAHAEFHAWRATDHVSIVFHVGTSEGKVMKALAHSTLICAPDELQRCKGWLKIADCKRPGWFAVVEILGNNRDYSGACGQPTKERAIQGAKAACKAKASCSSNFSREAFNLAVGYDPGNWDAAEVGIINRHQPGQQTTMCGPGPPATCVSYINGKSVVSIWTDNNL